MRQEWARMLPDFLKEQGYRNYHSGKWHLDGKVLAAGFDRSYDTRNQGNFFSSKGNALDDVPVKPGKDEKGFYTTIATADHAISCLEDHQEKYAGKPFFHYLAFIAPHFPLHALPEDIAKYRDTYLAGWDEMRKKRFARQKEMGLINTGLSALESHVGPPYHFPEALKKLGPGEVNRPLPWQDLNEEQRLFQATKMAIHAAMVDRMDQEIGRVISQLKKMGHFDNTLIFFASDNGASAEIMVRNGGHDPKASPGSAASYLCLGPGFSSACNTPFRRHKVWVHEGGIATPLVVHWPEGIEARNEIRHTPGHLIDIAPTIFEILGMKSPADWKGEKRPPLPGKSLASVLQKDQDVGRDVLWWSHEGNRGIRMGDWKLVAAKGDPWALYDLRTDRAEQYDLSKKEPKKAKVLENRWQSEQDAMIKLVKKSASAAKGKRKKK